MYGFTSGMAVGATVTLVLMYMFYLYGPKEGATMIEYGSTAPSLKASLCGCKASGFEGLSVTRGVKNPWVRANPYTMIMAARK